MVPTNRASWRWLPACASSGAFTLLATVLAVTERIPVADAVWMSVSVVIGLVPSGLQAPAGWRRRAAEAALIPAACSLVLVADLAMRRMLLPPLLVAAAGAALAAALRRTPQRSHPFLIGCFGLAVRAAGGLGLVDAGLLAAGLALVASFLTPWAVARWGWEVGIGAGLVVGVLPLARSPLIAVVIVVVTVWLYPWGCPQGWHARIALRWLPVAVAFGLLGASVAPWGGVGLDWAFPNAAPITGVALLLAAVATARLAPAAAGAVWFVALLALGPVQGPSPDRRAFRLSAADDSVVLPVGTGHRYVVDLALWGARNLEPGTPVATLETDGQTRTMMAGTEAVDAKVHVRPTATSVRHPLPDSTVWRPARIGFDGEWRVAARSVVEVAEGSSPALRRHPDLPERVRVAVDAAGPCLPTLPRDWSLPAWLWSTAVVVALLQLASGGWRSAAGLLPWCVLAVGQVATRVWLEPLRLVAERYAVDLCLAALLAAWIPAAWRWIKQGRAFRAATTLLVPLALATPHLTQPLYGDEPFHLIVMESLVEDRDLDISDDLDLEHHPDNRAYTLGDHLMHSPVLAVLLLPGYLFGGRTGALLLLALAGGGLVALIGRRARGLQIPERRLSLVLLVSIVTYPIATFSTQIWPEVLGALAVAAILVVAVEPRFSRWIAAGVALVATAIKTRLALVTFPPAMVLWLTGDRRRPAVGSAVLAAAALIGLAVGWLTMGHPFGYFRRVEDLVPSEPVLAIRVLGGLLFDHAGGLLFAAPILLAAVALLPALWRQGGSGERAVIVGGGLTVAALLHSPEWYGGGSPPARYLVPLVPVLALTWGVALRAPVRWRRLGELLLAPSLAAWWALITRPHFTVNPGDGGWWLADSLARRFAADTQQFFPSFLVPTTATFVLPVVVTVLAAAAVRIVNRRNGAVRLLVRTSVAVWLVSAAALAFAVATRCDRVVEAEAPQVRRRGGRIVPPAGTQSRFSYRNGWRVANGEGVIVPLKLPPRASVWLEGWLAGRAQQGARLEIRWDDGRKDTVKVSGSAKDGRLRLPDPPGEGRHRLEIFVRVPKRGAVILDRIIVER
jgi:hypothetical protein